VQPTTREQRFTATFTVPYKAGTLKVVGYKDGRPVAERELSTVGAPIGIRLTPDRDWLKAEAGDLSFVAVEVVDAEGRMHPHADHPIFFTVMGAGTLAAVGNSNPASEEAYQGNQRRAYRGRCLAVVKASGEPGEIRLRAQADGLEAAEVVIQVGG
jgi:beta-galactosidase